MKLYALCLIAVCLVELRPACAQAIDEDQARQRLLAVDEQFSKIRKKCCAFMAIVSSADNPAKPPPASVVLHSIYAKNSAGAVRHDIGYGGDALMPKDSREWMWSRTLRLKGKEEVRLQDNHSGGISNPKQPLFFKLFDPLCVSSAAYGDVLSGQVEEDWFTKMFANAEFLDGATTEAGDLELSLVTAKNRKCIARVSLGKAVGYLPTRVQLFHNIAADVSGAEKIGPMFGETRTEWKKAGDSYVPRVVTIDVPNDSEGVHRNYEIEMEWLLGDFDESLVFDEEAMRYRWDSLDTLWLDLNASEE